MNDTNEDFISDLKLAFDVMNKRLFDNKLKNVDFIVRNKKKVGLRWIVENNAIVIGSDFLNVEFEEILSILLHEMVHIDNFQANIVDVTDNQYHNKKFLAIASQKGLVLIKHKTQGWSITSTFVPRNVVNKLHCKKPTKQQLALRIETFQSITLNRLKYRELQREIREKIKQEKPAKTYFLKYECNCLPPHNSIRSGRRSDGPNALNICCLNCNSNFKCVENFDKESIDG